MSLQTHTALACTQNILYIRPYTKLHPGKPLKRTPEIINPTGRTASLLRYAMARKASALVPTHLDGTSTLTHIDMRSNVARGSG